MIASLLFLVAAGFLAGGMNALAGAGSFVTLTALIAAGVPAVAANASSTVALYPGGVASAWTYQIRFTPVCGVAMPVMLAITVVGGLFGSLLLLFTPGAAFDLALPWLLLLATLALLFGRRLGAALQGRLRGHRAPSRARRIPSPPPRLRGRAAFPSPPPRLRGRAAFPSPPPRLRGGGGPEGWRGPRIAGAPHSPLLPRAFAGEGDPKGGGGRVSRGVSNKK